MPAAVHVLTGPAGAGKTARLLDRLRTVQCESPGTALWIVPNRRTADALRPHLVDCGFGLALCSFQDFVEAIIRDNDPQAQPLSGLQRRLLAEELIADLHARKVLSHFERVIDTRGFAEAVFALLAELKENEIWPEHLARVAGQRGPKGEQCLRIYERYQDYLVRNHLYDLEGRFWYARDLLARGRFQPFESVRAVFVDGFTRFTRTQSEILHALAGHAEELWVSLPDDADDGRGELFAGPRSTLKKFESLKPKVSSLPPARALPHRGEGNPTPWPAGLAHVERQLFRRPRAVQQSACADGVRLIEAPGTLGETRLVAREIKQLLLGGVPARDILVTMRDLVPYADLVREVFAEYGIPVDVEGVEPLLRNPAVATLLRAVRLPEDGWPFAGVTALLRSSYFQPNWPETRSDPEIAQHAEALLRLLGEPRGRETYLRAVENWAEKPQEGLEDEEADEPRRQRTHQLARRCGPFLRRFFQTWDHGVPVGTLGNQTTAFRQFAEELGLVRAAADRPHDQAALALFFDELERWVVLEGRLLGERRRDRVRFLRLLLALAAGAGLARTVRGPGRVRVLSAELARAIEVPYLFVMGLGERSFPDLSAPEPFLDEGDRQAFRQTGLDLPGVADRMPDEMLLFYQIITRARRRLTLSYPAVDDKGQALLPSSFLGGLLECFEPGCFAPGTDHLIRQRMLIEGYEQQVPLSPGEYRVQVSRSLGGTAAKGLSTDLAKNLTAAAALHERRMNADDFGPYDGRLRHPAVAAGLQERYRPEYVFSPTALETYIACPFQFFLRNVLRLEPLGEPREEIEQTRRGAAFHRALSRLHRQLRADGIDGPNEEVREHLLAQLKRAVEEHVERAASPASKMLWRLEGKRLEKAAARYHEHWKKFITPWAEQYAVPKPEQFEAGFGLRDVEVKPLVIVEDNVEVRIGGRIDRVDVAELEDGLGFWVIDYKTGNPNHYRAVEVTAFLRLQLLLYALAVEDVLLAGRPARPLGLAYWLVTDTGPRVVLPASRQPTAWLADARHWPPVRDRLRRWVATLAKHIRQGDFMLRPRSPDCTDACDFSQVCRISESRRVVEQKNWTLSLPVLER